MVSPAGQSCRMVQSHLYNSLGFSSQSQRLRLDWAAPKLLFEKELRNQGGPFSTSWLNRMVSLMKFVCSCHSPHNKVVPFQTVNMQQYLYLIHSESFLPEVWLSKPWRVDHLFQTHSTTYYTAATVRKSLIYSKGFCFENLLFEEGVQAPFPLY